MSTSNAEDIIENAFDGEVIPPSLALKAMRDSGYKNTAYALAELIDNSVQANASFVEIFCIEKRVLVKERERRRIAEIAVLDNGSGMDMTVLRLALQFGNGTHLNDRSGIGRFGMGLPNASISQCRRLDVWTWQAGPDNALHSYLDLDDVESGKTRHVPVPEAKNVPNEWLSRSEGIGTTGTLIVWSNFEDHRLTWRSGRATLENTEALVGRMYRKFIHEGKTDIRLAALEDDTSTFDMRARANDPMYLTVPSSTPAPFDKRPMFKVWGEQHREFPVEYEGETHSVHVRMSWASSETIPDDGTDRGRTPYGKHAAKNIGVSIVRAGRELELDSTWALGYDPRERWWGVEVEFPPALDEVFGVTNNKQAATVFSHMSQFEWENEAEPGEKYMDFKSRLEEEGDTRHLVIDIVVYVREQLAQIRNRIQDQTKGIRGGGKRHDDVSIEDKATTKWKDRANKGYKTDIDDEDYDDKARDDLTNDLIKNKNYSEEVAKEIAQAVKTRGRKLIFVTAETDSQAFFNVDIRPGGITEIVFNTRHPVYEKLVRALDTDVTETSSSELVTRIENASDTLKLLLAAWARYEEEDYPARDRIRDIRHEWGKMAKNFIGDED
ncbi:ATP-binding protein [Aestuariispira insulae]|uniref:Histidine kinase/DNA gyrase B/HSP90-like ATPase n=1 Tax=Aestuariispira insulae TaxID=1461337 RepID=A0A3D9H6A2_9PROT|nr:ATP-binding protein [Aestuariispira insulae]RED45014.1 histidine kinase/DNA gyrase B/HSP90-like ATPase [Aestuariispira insulae]